MTGVINKMKFPMETGFIDVQNAVKDFIPGEYLMKTVILPAGSCLPIKKKAIRSGR